MTKLKEIICSHCGEADLYDVGTTLMNMNPIPEIGEEFLPEKRKQSNENFDLIKNKTAKKALVLFITTAMNDYEAEYSKNNHDKLLEENFDFEELSTEYMLEKFTETYGIFPDILLFKVGELFELVGIPNE